MYHSHVAGGTVRCLTYVVLTIWKLLLSPGNTVSNVYTSRYVGMVGTGSVILTDLGTGTNSYLFHVDGYRFLNWIFPNRYGTGTGTGIQIGMFVPTP